MSGNDEKRLNNFYSYCVSMLKGESGKMLYRVYRETIESVTPSIVVKAFHKLVEDGYSMEEIKSTVNRVLHTVFIPLKNYPSLKYSENGLVHLLMVDNAEMEKRLNSIKPLIKLINKKKDRKTLEEIKNRFELLKKFEKHYIVKENIVFPILERVEQYFKCTHIMWSFDDDIKRNLKLVNEILDKGECDLKLFNKVVGRLFFDMFAISFRENRILYPYLLEIVEEEEINAHLGEVKEMGLPFVEVGIDGVKDVDRGDKSLEINLETGSLTLQQLELIFKHLPIDITFVDENNEVRFFSNPVDRIFPRTKAVLGRKVQNCHPPDSIGIVNKIIEKFRNGERDRAEFWINYKGKFVLIEYFAIRDGQGKYRGVLEVTQDISKQRSLKGEKKLLDWE